MRKKIFVLVIFCIALCSCGGGSGGGDGMAGAPYSGTGDPAPNGPVTGSGQGFLRISITDAPAPEYQEINVTVSGVRVHRSADAGTGEAGWYELTLDSPVRLNLLDLQNGLLFALGVLPLEAGHYQQIRLMLVPNSSEEPPYANSVVFPSGENTIEMSLEIPGEDVSGIKLVHQFRIEEGKTMDLILDLDGKKSIVRRGNGTFMLKPVIKANVVEVAATN